MPVPRARLRRPALPDQRSKGGFAFRPAAAGRQGTSSWPVSPDSTNSCEPAASSIPLGRRCELLRAGTEASDGAGPKRTTPDGTTDSGRQPTSGPEADAPPPANCTAITAIRAAGRRLRARPRPAVPMPNSKGGTQRVQTRPADALHADTHAALLTPYQTPLGVGRPLSNHRVQARSWRLMACPWSLAAVGRPGTALGAAVIVTPLCRDLIK